MTDSRGLVVNLDRCIGCYACEVACKQEHSLAVGEHGIQLHTMGPYEIDGQLAMDFLPLATDKCDLCADRVASGGRTFCAEVCPTQALSLRAAPEILRLLRSNARVHICKMEKR